MKTCVLLLFFIASSAFARDAAADREIAWLIGEVEKADASFIRNGKEYPPAEAATHMRDKLKSAGDRVQTTEEFIEGVASKSYLSGKPYQMKLPNGTLQPAGLWLSAALKRHRGAVR